MKLRKHTTYKLLPLILIMLVVLSGCKFNFGSKLLSKLNPKTELQQNTVNEEKPNNLNLDNTNSQPDDPKAIAYEFYKNALNFEEQAKALKMFQDLAKSNDPYACLKLGEMYLQGIGTEKNTEIAMKWFQKAANHGSLKAMWEIGKLYRWGISENYSLGTAIDWYKKAANLGYVDAMLVLGEIYRGYGLPSDYNQSM